MVLIIPSNHIPTTSKGFKMSEEQNKLEESAEDTHRSEEYIHDASYSMFTENMSFSNQTFLLTQALIQAKEKMGNVIEYDSRNPHYKNRFASLEATLTKINPVFAEFGLVLSHWPAGNKLISRLEHVSGQWMMSAYDLSAIKKDPQQMGSAITYARRYCAQAIAGLCGGEDDDAEMAMAPSAASSPSISVGGPKQKPEDIFEEFVQSIPEDQFEQALSEHWDDLMRRTNKLQDRKKLANLLNAHKNKNSGDDL